MTGQDRSRRGRGSGAPELYDFTQPMTLTREHSRAIEVALQNFARQWSTVLSSRLGVLATVDLEGLELTGYDAYIHTLPQSTTGVTLMFEPSRTTALLQIPTRLTMTLVDCLLGGPAADLGMEFRELTDIEWTLMSDMLGYACTELGNATRSIAPMSFSLRGVRYSPSFMQLAPAQEPVLVGRFHMSVGPVDEQVTLMVLAEPVVNALRAADEDNHRSAEEQREHDLAVDMLTARLTEVPIPVAVRFEGRSMTAAEVSGLEVGAIVSLHHSVDQPLDVVVDDVCVAHAAIGANGTRVACLVVSTEEEE
ncbi:FliM/FliN family flagellar motor switch protein [Demequina capsici]|uniref:Flagellar motor switch protein FliM n=1 Tax=Demequina capsici TaxID=3075620 RepID=A0AA96FBV6_9MICO|nr:FliM/FliN family flagellar motor switch protein [Demequina sp. PMTSA13]WNM27414.1 FliM/FliN family flagellar motor switch protein [Demequina sp. PMTSA13]